MVSGKHDRQVKFATFEENRRAVEVLDAMRDKIKGTYRGGEGSTAVITTCPGDR